MAETCWTEKKFPLPHPPSPRPMAAERFCQKIDLPATTLSQRGEFTGRAIPSPAMYQTFGTF